MANTGQNWKKHRRCYRHIIFICKIVGLLLLLLLLLFMFLFILSCLFSFIICIKAQLFKTNDIVSKRIVKTLIIEYSNNGNMFY